MVARGQLEEERVELLRGELVSMSPQGPLHATIIRRLNKHLMRALMERGDVQIQAPLAVSDDSEPEPDVAVIEPGDYAREHPTSALLVIEVADSSLARDREVKAPLYAECGVPEYWIVNIAEQVIEVHASPEGGAYRRVTTKSLGDVIELVGFPGARIAIDDILS